MQMSGANEVNPTGLVAWEVEVRNMSCIVFAATAPKARWQAVKGYWAAGYGRGPGTWPRPEARREPMFDRSPMKDQPPQCWSRDYVWSTM